MGVCLGLFFIDTCSLFRIGESYSTAAGSGFLTGDPSDEDKISSIIGGPDLLSCSLQLLEQLTDMTCGLVGKAVFVVVVWRMKRIWP